MQPLPPAAASRDSLPVRKVADLPVGSMLVSGGHDLAAARFGAEYVEAALAASGRRLLWVDPAEVDDDLVREVTEILASLCARLYGRRRTAPRERSPP